MGPLPIQSSINLIDPGRSESLFLFFVCVCDRGGIIQPMTIGPDGKPQPVSHMLDLVEGDNPASLDPSAPSRSGDPPEQEERE